MYMAFEAYGHAANLEKNEKKHGLVGLAEGMKYSPKIKVLESLKQLQVATDELKGKNVREEQLSSLFLKGYRGSQALEKQLNLEDAVFKEAFAQPQAWNSNPYVLSEAREIIRQHQEQLDADYAYSKALQKQVAVLRKLKVPKLDFGDDPSFQNALGITLSLRESARKSIQERQAKLLGTLREEGQIYEALRKKVQPRWYERWRPSGRQEAVAGSASHATLLDASYEVPEGDAKLVQEAEVALKGVDPSVELSKQALDPSIQKQHLQAARNSLDKAREEQQKLQKEANTIMGSIKERFLIPKGTASNGAVLTPEGATSREMDPDRFKWLLLQSIRLKVEIGTKEVNLKKLERSLKPSLRQKLQFWKKPKGAQAKGPGTSPIEDVEGATARQGAQDNEQEASRKIATEEAGGNPPDTLQGPSRSSSSRTSDMTR